MQPNRSTKTSRIINATREAIYAAFLDRDALLRWLPPGDMTGAFSHFDAREGGGYHMSLLYPESETERRGKTSAREDGVRVRFLELVRPSRIVESVTFDSGDPAFGGEMIFEATFTATGAGTEVTIVCRDIPRGIRPEDNDAGARSSLEKLARYIEK